MRISRQTWLKTLGALVAATVPAVVVAQVVSFESNTVLQADQLNALVDEINDLAAEVDRLSNRPSIGDCDLTRTVCSDTQTCRASCPEGSRILAGGCDMNLASNLRQSGPASGESWLCSVNGSASTIRGVWTLCCPE